MSHFGVQLHGTFPMGSYPRLAELVERYEFTELTIHDIVWWRPVWPIVALVAQATERVLVGPDVTNPYLRHPADTAANVAGIDELSGGRAILGLGAGGMFERIGLEQRQPRDAVRECAELVQRLLARDRTPYRGKIFEASPEATFNWKPVRSSVPVFVGAVGPKMLATAATWADEIRPPAIWDTRFFLDVKRRVGEAAGDRQVQVGCDVWLVMDEDRGRARELGRRVLAQFLPARQFSTLIDFYGIDPEEVEAVGDLLAAGDVDAAAKRISDTTLDLFVAAGTPAEIADGLAGLVEAGAETITFSGRLGIDPATAIETLGETVLPRVRASLEAAAEEPR
jgi:5,10-methylenetetrahydromethanopterin reductase